MSETQAGETPRILFDAMLHPHRSLSPRGFRLLLGVFSAVSLTLGLLFFALGAWPVFGFLGLDILLLWLAFRVSYRAGRMYESVRLTEEELLVRRVDHHGRQRSWSFQPYWLRVLMDDPPEPDSQVTLTSHGRSLVVGAFLSPDERLDFAKALRNALAGLRRPSAGTG